MTQKIFDTDNEEDMKLLWSILPESIERIVKDETPEGNSYNRYYAKDYCYGGCAFIKINWHDKTEITRPVNYEDMIGCVCWFWDNDEDNKELGILTKIDNDEDYGFNYRLCEKCYFMHVKPAKKSELKFYGE